jgi:hypothetical protein
VRSDIDIHKWSQVTAWPGMGKKVAPTFEFIDSARDVYDLVRQAQKETNVRDA